MCLFLLKGSQSASSQPGPGGPRGPRPPIGQESSGDQGGPGLRFPGPRGINPSLRTPGFFQGDPSRLRGMGGPRGPERFVSPSGPGGTGNPRGPRVPAPRESLDEPEEESEGPQPLMNFQSERPFPDSRFGPRGPRGPRVGICLHLGIKFDVLTYHLMIKMTGTLWFKSKILTLFGSL